MKSRLFLFVILSFLITSCGRYIDSMHKEFDRADSKNRPIKKRDSFAQYRYPNQFKTQSNLTTTRQLSRIDPATKRNYQQTAPGKRFTADDLNDNSANQSLWTGAGKLTSLYTDDTEKKNGDIVLINVMATLKNEITLELKRQAPPPRKKKDNKKDAAAAGAAQATAATTPPEPPKPDEQEATDTEKVYDKISSVIIETIQQEHLLLRGMKNVLFNNQKHLVEVQALVSRRDVDIEDAVNSDKIIEYSIQVVR